MSENHFGTAEITRHISSSILTSGILPAWTGVKFTWERETVSEAGTDDGRVMEIENPWATPQAAADLLAQIKDDAYLPFEAHEVVINPAVEIGDAVEVADGLSVIFAHTAVYDSLYSDDVSAPADEEIDHEFPYSEPANLDQSDIEDMISDALEDPDSEIFTGLEDFLGDELAPDGMIGTAIADIDSLFTRGNDHVEITTDHMALVTGYDPHAEPDPEGETPEPVTADTKLYIGYEYSGETQGGDAILSPIIILGAGNAGGTNVARIRKDTNGFDLTYDTNNPNVPQDYIRMTPDGRIEIYPLDLSSIYESIINAAEGTAEEQAVLDDVKEALQIPSAEDIDQRIETNLPRTKALDFSSWDGGFFSETTELDETFPYTVVFDSSNRPIEIIAGDGFVTEITW